MGLKPWQKPCPSCGEPMDDGAARCATCYRKSQQDNKCPHYRGRHPLKQCPSPGCHTLIHKTSEFCHLCRNLRRTKAWKEAVSRFTRGLEHEHFWLPHDTYHQCLICQSKQPHYWILHELTNYGKCSDCGAEKQFPTAREQLEIMTQHRHRPQARQVPVLLDEEAVAEMV